MENYTVVKKGTEDAYYVLSMPESETGTILIANVETGQMHLIKGMELFIQHFNFDDIIDDDDEEDEEPQSSEL